MDSVEPAFANSATAVLTLLNSVAGVDEVIGELSPQAICNEGARLEAALSILYFSFKVFWLGILLWANALCSDSFWCLYRHTQRC